MSEKPAPDDQAELDSTHTRTEIRVARSFGDFFEYAYCALEDRTPMIPLDWTVFRLLLVSRLMGIQPGSFETVEKLTEKEAVPFENGLLPIGRDKELIAWKEESNGKFMAIHTSAASLVELPKELARQEILAFISMITRNSWGLYGQEIENDRPMKGYWEVNKFFNEQNIPEVQVEQLTLAFEFLKTLERERFITFGIMFDKYTESQLNLSIPYFEITDKIVRESGEFYKIILQYLIESNQGGRIDISQLEFILAIFGDRSKLDRFIHTPEQSILNKVLIELGFSRKPEKLKVIYNHPRGSFRLTFNTVSLLPKDIY